MAERAAPSRLRVAVEISGVDETAAEIEQMARRAYHTGPLMEAIVEELAVISRARVRRAPWKPLTPGTIARKDSQGEDTGIFRDEWRPIKGVPTRQGDMLYRALTEDGATGQFRYSTRTWAVFGVDSKGQGPLFYARFVQNVHGTKRRILAISGEQAVAIGAMTSRWIMSGSKTGGILAATPSHLLRSA